MIVMWKSKKVIKGIWSLLEKIDLHFEKFEKARKRWDVHAMKYYVKEIESSLWGNVMKDTKKIRVSIDLKIKILSVKSKINEIKSIPLN